MSRTDPVPDLVAAAASALSQGVLEEARSALISIPQAALVAERAAAHKPVWGPGGVGRGLSRPPKQARREASRSLKLATFRRDSFVCRYEHCRRRTIALPVLKALSRAFPDLVPYHSNWNPVDQHILYWLYSASLEHHRSFLHEGTSDPDNLLTACYGCNDLKNWLHADVLGWVVAPPYDGPWDGLESLIPSLRERGYISQRDL